MSDRRKIINMQWRNCPVCNDSVRVRVSGELAKHGPKFGCPGGLPKKSATDANEVLCRILELETLSIGSEPVLRYSEVLAAFAAR